MLDPSVCAMRQACVNIPRGTDWSVFNESYNLLWAPWTPTHYVTTAQYIHTQVCACTYAYTRIIYTHTFTTDLLLDSNYIRTWANEKLNNLYIAVWSSVTHGTVISGPQWLGLLCNNDEIFGRWKEFARNFSHFLT